ncbi:MAG: hypothetical protein JNM70_09625 [Anaerolineae bacterium]|nr:hypothetical protein [Anaerolineae bacterium]
MRIEALTLYTRSAADQRRFFLDVFGFTPQNSSDTTLTLQVGDSLLQFEQQDGWRGFYHYAFLIPQNQFEAARAWLAGRVPLLRDAQGQEVFFFEGWNAHTVYFADADGNIGELIARHDHPVSGAGAFSVESLVNVNEIGRVVEDVDAEVKRLQQEAGLLPFGSYRPGGDFAAVGDRDGLFIVVKEGRPWFPVRWPAARGMFSAVIETPRGRLRFSAEPSKP